MICLLIFVAQHARMICTLSACAVGLIFFAIALDVQAQCIREALARRRARKAHARMLLRMRDLLRSASVNSAYAQRNSASVNVYSMRKLTEIARNAKARQ